IASLALAVVSSAIAPDLAQRAPSEVSGQRAEGLTLEVQNYVEAPVTGLVDGTGTNDVLLARVNAIREEVGGANRLFVSDLNGPLYILDKAARKFSVYLDFNGNEGRKGIFHKLTFAQGFGNGLNGFYLDP